MIQPGLDRIRLLLKGVSFPWKSIHVAGTNGKGSICHHAALLLTHRQIKVGKFSSPHLVDRWDCISINDKPVEEKWFKKVEKHYVQLNEKENIGASPFEILTATAFTLFSDNKVQVGVVEVGMGGKLDATNILDNQSISVISKIARDHESFLGNTLDEIASHKAGILRPNVPYIVNPMNENNVQNVIDDYAKEIGAGSRLPLQSPELRENLFSSKAWHNFAASLQPFQRDNAVLATIAARQVIQDLGLTMKWTNVTDALRNTTNHGRLKNLILPPVFSTGPKDTDMSIIVDGAHNPDAAQELNGYIKNKERRRVIPVKRPPGGGWPVTWVLAMTEGKDASKYLQTLLWPNDNVIATSFGPVDGMPWVKSMDSKALLEVAKSVEPSINGLAIPIPGALRSIAAAKAMAASFPDHSPIVLTGSLYLVGDLYRELRNIEATTDNVQSGHHETARVDPQARPSPRSDTLVNIMKDERTRVALHFSGKPSDIPVDREHVLAAEQDAEERRKIQAELEGIDQELMRLDNEERARKEFTDKLSRHGPL